MTAKQIEEMVRKIGIEEIDLYVKCALDRYRELFPEWELVYMAIPKYNQEERSQTIQYIIENLRKSEQL